MDGDSTYKPRNVSRAELVRPDDDPPPACADGTQYYRFKPGNRPPHGVLFSFFDRFVVTTLFTIFDIVILLPVLAWIVLALAASLFVVGIKLFLAVWHLALRFVPLLTHALVHWLSLLAIWLLHYLHWLQRV
jgi:hypothetical protein